MLTWPYLAEDMVPLSVYMLDTGRPVEQPKNRLRKSNAFKNLTISAQWEQIDFPLQPQLLLLASERLEDSGGGRASTVFPCLVIGLFFLVKSSLNPLTLWEVNYIVSSVLTTDATDTMTWQQLVLAEYDMGCCRVKQRSRVRIISAKKPLNENRPRDYFTIICFWSW